MDEAHHATIELHITEQKAQADMYAIALRGVLEAKGWTVDFAPLRGTQDADRGLVKIIIDPGASVPEADIEDHAAQVAEETRAVLLNAKDSSYDRTIQVFLRSDKLILERRVEPGR